MEPERLSDRRRALVVRVKRVGDALVKTVMRQVAKALIRPVSARRRRPSPDGVVPVASASRSFQQGQRTLTGVGVPTRGATRAEDRTRQYHALGEVSPVLWEGLTHLHGAPALTADLTAPDALVTRPGGTADHLFRELSEVPGCHLELLGRRN